jgi:hypothetical protein
MRNNTISNIAIKGNTCLSENLMNTIGWEKGGCTNVGPYDSVGAALPATSMPNLTNPPVESPSGTRDKWERPGSGWAQSGVGDQHFTYYGNVHAHEDEC